MRSIYGLIVSGASVWPMKTLAQTLVVSAPDTFITLVMIHAMPRTMRCMTPRWYSTPVSEAKKMIVGSTCTANTKPNLLVSVKRAEDELGTDADEIEQFHESGRDRVEHIAAERNLEHQRREHQLQRDAAQHEFPAHRALVVGKARTRCR